MPVVNDVRWFSELGAGDIGAVGGKNAALGELYSSLMPKGINVPNGFALTADLYRATLSEADAWQKLEPLLASIGSQDVRRLAAAAATARIIVYEATGTARVRAAVAEGYLRLEREYGRDVSVAVRSSATAEDLPTASFAGQHESFLNVAGVENVFEACRRCFASIFTDRAIIYRNDNGFDHLKVALSVGVMKMVRSDLAASGVAFTLDTESGFRDVVFVTGAYGLGENVVQGRVDPDEYYVHKPTFLSGYRAVLRRRLGRKQQALVFAEKTSSATTVNVAPIQADRERFCLSDKDVLTIAGGALRIEAHFSGRAGSAVPMDIEWAKDGPDGRIYFVQARPETFASRRPPTGFETFQLKQAGQVLLTGRAVGEKIASGRVRLIENKAELAAFQPGEVLVSETTSPDWEPVMKQASAIVTDRGGRTCHAAIVARELGIPAIVGTDNATKLLEQGALVTVSCAEGDLGRIYRGRVPFQRTVAAVDATSQTQTKVMVNLGNPDMAFRTACRFNGGVGLARMEFIITETIGIHPMALAHPERVTNPADRDAIRRATHLFPKPADFFVERLAEGVGTIAAAFFPQPVIVRLSDFKTNEYAKLVGGAGFEPKEEIPMLGFRGAARYAHPAYADGFALECAAIRYVREQMGLTNLKVMVPFCRRIDEAHKVLEAMAANGLKRGANGLEVYLMCEIPNNVIQIDAFSALFDGFSIGSNDLTQLTLAVDRDSQIVAFDFDEQDPGMLEMLRQAVIGARRNRRYVGICGEAPANHPELAKFLVRLGIDSISVNPDSVPQTVSAIRDAEQMIQLAKVV